ncbi:hypothetical protein FHR94_003770 [Halomonas cerina]|uniref:Uncharacterized protein n=1 Tax=Halomonas cerina TaxID=447424 RepID=A0A839VIR6_9GAMM|nr:hypothetical protein [Halomonas cerina]
MMTDRFGVSGMLIVEARVESEALLDDHLIQSGLR